MSRSVGVRKPTTSEFRKLNALIEEAEDPRQRRRAHALVLYAAGLNAQEIARALAVHANTVYADLHAFAQQGLACVQPPPARGAPPRITPAQLEEIERFAQTAPIQLGLPEGRWSLANLRGYLLKKRIVKRISREHLRQLLKKRTFISGTSSGSCLALIPSGGPF